MAGSSWEGLLIPLNRAFFLRGTVLNLPGNDLKRVELKADGSKFKLSVRGQSDFSLVSQTISTDGLNLIVRFLTIEQSQVVKAQHDLNQPGRLPQSKFVLPVRARAIAPPVGMAIGSMLLQPGDWFRYLARQSLTTKHADARELLMSLSRVGGYGIALWRIMSLDLQGQITRPINLIDYRLLFLLKMNLFQGFQYYFDDLWPSSSFRRWFDTVGKMLAQSIENQLSKVYRLNQVDPVAAEHGESRQLLKRQMSLQRFYGRDYNCSRRRATTGGSMSLTTTSTNSTTVEIEAYGATTGPLLVCRAQLTFASVLLH